MSFESSSLLKLNFLSDDKKDLLAIGWDVGGWMGTNHGFSIIHWNYKDKEIKWLGEAVELKIPAYSIFDLEYIIKKASKRNDLNIYNLI